MPYYTRAVQDPHAVEEATNNISVTCPRSLGPFPGETGMQRAATAVLAARWRTRHTTSNHEKYKIFQTPTYPGLQGGAPLTYRETGDPSARFPGGGVGHDVVSWRIR